MCGSGFSGNVHFSSIQILEQCLKIPTCITAGALFSTRPRKFSGISEQSAIHTLFNWSLQRKRQRHHRSSKSECSDCLLGSDSDVLRRLRLAMWKNCATKATERHLGQIAPEQSDMANQSHLGHSVQIATQAGRRCDIFSHSIAIATLILHNVQCT